MSLVAEVQNVFRILRELCKNKSRLLKKIDANYEEILIGDLNLIPKQYEGEIMVWVNVVKVVLKNIQFAAIASALGTLCAENDYLKANLCLNIDVYAKIGDLVNKLQIKNIDKARIMNIVKKFQPLCDVIKDVLKDIVGFVTNVGKLTSAPQCSKDLDDALGF